MPGHIEARLGERSWDRLAEAVEAVGRQNTGGQA